MNYQIIFTLVSVILNFENVYCESTTQRVIPKQFNMSYHSQIVKQISEEIKKMKLPNFPATYRNKSINVSWSAMKFQRILPQGDLSQIKFKLYNRENMFTPKLICAQPDCLTKVGFDPLKPLKVVIHGWLLNSLYESCIAIKNSYLKYLDVNIIVVDWGDVGNHIYYPCVAAQAKAVGWHIGIFINFLIDFGCICKNMHLIGHSLGPHIAAFASEVMSGKVGRITALDPALPGFVLNTLSQFGGAGRLMPSHAQFVDVIHSNGGTLGMIDAVGHVDFYPNGGQIQPGCWIINFLCSHYRSYDLWDESIGKCKFPAKPCNPESIPQREILMGEPVPYSARGQFCLNTNNQPPYGILNRPNLPPRWRRLDTDTFRGHEVKHVEATNSGSVTKFLCIFKLIVTARAFM